MSVIYPGNYVAGLNAYRDQGVYALPGIEFYQAIGAAIVSSSQTGGGTLAVEIQSPDLRQDDKPRLDKPLVVPAGAVVYRTTLNLQGCSRDPDHCSASSARYRQPERLPPVHWFTDPSGRLPSLARSGVR